MAEVTVKKMPRVTGFSPSRSTNKNKGVGSPPGIRGLITPTLDNRGATSGAHSNGDGLRVVHVA